MAIQVNEEINGLGVTVEDLPGSSFGVSEGRFDFDARVELLFHGLDPPITQTLTLPDLLNAPAQDSLVDIQASGTFSLELPITDFTQTYLIIYTGSDNVFDSAPQRDLFHVEVPKALIVSGSPVEADIENTLTDDQLNAL